MPPDSLTNLSLLVVEDEPLLRKQIAAYLEKLGADVTSADTIQKTRNLVAELSFDFALLDVNLPDGRGTDLLKEKLFPPSTGVVVMTAEGGVSGAVEAIRLGALDYIVKPFDPAELPLVISRANRSRQSRRIDEFKRAAVSESHDSFFFGSALSSLEAQLQKILEADKRLESHLSPVLIEGETGTGKTTIARWIHHQGPRASQPLVEVNCSAFPETLAESELFGHERGAFTDARTARIGLFEAAEGGTLFLDELPSLSLGMQAKILTSIEDRKIRRVGGNKPIHIDVRIIGATNRDLKGLVASGQFREDLYHRLDLFHIVIPPLRQRGDDIVALADRLLLQLNRRHRLNKTIHPSGLHNLIAHPWPGNVRELAHELERALVFEEGNELLFPRLTTATPPPASTAAPDSAQWFNPHFSFPAQGFALDEAINRLIQHALIQTGQNVSAAARLLGVSRDYLRYRLSGKKKEDSPASPETPA